MKTQIAVLLLSALVLNTAPAATNYIWIGPDKGLWSLPDNWSPNGAPGTDPADTIQINADPHTASTIIADVSCTVQSVTTTGKVIFRGTLDATGNPENTLHAIVANSTFLDIWDMNLKGQLNNQTGAQMRLRQIRGSLDIVNHGELRWYLINTLEGDSYIANHGMMRLVDPAVLYSYGPMLNTGNISISFATMAFDAGATLTNEGSIYGAGSLFLIDTSLENSGAINSMFGDLLVTSTGDTVNYGWIANQPGTLLFMTTQTNTTVFNYGTIAAMTGGGVNLFPADVANEPGGIIRMQGGFLSARYVEIKAYSAIQGRGELIGFLSIEQDTTADFYSDFAVTRSLYIEPLAKVTVEDGRLLVEGDIDNEGSIRLKSSRLIPRDGIYGDGQILWDISDYNTLTDYNLDGKVNMEDLAVFAQTWLWQSPL